MAKTKELSFTEAKNELDLINQEIENGEISIDILAEKVERALFLIKYCKEKLKNTESKMADLVKLSSE
jgi:exodeoxyribonuclease VII small subunit